MVELIRDFADENRLKWEAILDGVQAQLAVIEKIDAQALSVPGHLRTAYADLKRGIEIQQRRCLNATTGRSVMAVQPPNEEMEFAEIRKNKATLDMVWKAVMG